MKNQMLAWGESINRDKLLSQIQRIKALDASVQINQQVRDWNIQLFAQERNSDSLATSHVPYKHEAQQAYTFSQILDEIRAGELLSCDVLSLCELHGRLFNTYEDAGKMSSFDNCVKSVNEDGDVSRVYRAAPAHKKEHELEWVCSMYAQALKCDPDFSLVYAACLVEHLFEVHPFVDGNGRVSRIMLISEMKRMGFERAADIPFEVCYKKYRKLVFIRCEQADDGYYSREITYAAFVELMLDLIELSYKKLRDGALA